MRKIGPAELLLLLGISVLFFGDKKIPDIVDALREGIRNFWNGGPGGPAAA